MTPVEASALQDGPHASEQGVRMMQSVDTVDMEAAVRAVRASLQAFARPGFAAAFSTRHGLISSHDVLTPATPVTPSLLVTPITPISPTTPVGQAAFSALGNSTAPFDRLNFGDHVGDDPSAVALNRAQAAEVFGCSPFYCQQVHGTRVLRVPYRADALNPHGSQPPSAEERIDTTADASVSREPLQACTMMVADCLPILLTAESTGSGTPRLAVAAVHAGWRGLAAGVLEAAVQGLREECVGTSDPLVHGPVNLRAWLGPCIGPSAFEVGHEVVTGFGAFLSRYDSRAEDFFHPIPARIPQSLAAAFDRNSTARPHAPTNPSSEILPAKFHADLAGLARLALAQLGVKMVFGNDGSAAWCTYTQASLWFSHRRSTHDAQRPAGRTGRMAAFIWCT